MDLHLFQVDAFADEVFQGNPAAVCPLETWLPDETLQKIALENNLSETAFFVPSTEEGVDYDLRWFTPRIEVDLCGHATHASAYVVFEELGHGWATVNFGSRSGVLSATRSNGAITLDFPSIPPVEHELPADGEGVIGDRPLEFYHSPMKWLAVFGSEKDVRSLAPDLTLLASWEPGILIATAPGENSDFVSRVFCPGVGIPEDPVTGSAHSVLTPYWATRLERTTLTAYQASARGGRILCELHGDRVSLTGHAKLYLRGTITIP